MVSFLIPDFAGSNTLTLPGKLASYLIGPLTSTSSSLSAKCSHLNASYPTFSLDATTNLLTFPHPAVRIISSPSITSTLATLTSSTFGIPSNARRKLDPSHATDASSANPRPGPGRGSRTSTLATSGPRWAQSGWERVKPNAARAMGESKVRWRYAAARVNGRSARETGVDATGRKGGESGVEGARKIWARISGGRVVRKSFLVDCGVG